MNQRTHYFVSALVNPVSITIASLYLLVIATRASIGYWPQYHYPDAGVLTAVPHPEWHLVTMFLFSCAFISGPIAAVVLAVSIWKRWRTERIYAMGTLGAWMFGIVLFISDPGGFISWFFD